jgi:hypothetical protein
MEASATVERRLVAVYSRIDREALRVLREVLPQALAAGTPEALDEALRTVQLAVDGALPDAEIAAAARRAAAQQDNIARRAFFPALAAATGLAIIGSDQVTARAPRARPRRRGPQLVPKLNFNTTILANGFVDRNTRLISTVRQGVAEGVRDQVIRALQFSPGGRVPDPEDLARRLIKQWERKGVPTRIPIRRLTASGEPVTISAKKHARLVARDQVLSLNGQLAKARQTSAGITKFVWMPSTAADPRESHEEFYGQTFTWAEGAGGIIPGEEIMCQCHARAVIDKDQVLADGEFTDISGAGDLFTSRDIVATSPGPGASL